MGEEAGRIEVSGLTKRFGLVTAVDGLQDYARQGRTVLFSSHALPRSSSSRSAW